MLHYDVHVVEDRRLPFDKWMLIESTGGDVTLVMRRSAVGDSTVLAECRAALDQMGATARRVPGPRQPLDPAIVA